MSLFTTEEILVTESEFNEINDGYQFLETQIEYCDEEPELKFDEKLATAIKYGNVKNLHIQKRYFRFACKFNHPEVIELFISKYNDLDMSLVLEIACSHKNINICRFALLNGADIHKNEDRAIVIAVIIGNFELVKLLIDNGANFRTMNDICFTLACKNENINIVKLLIEKGVNISKSLKHVTCGNNLEIVSYLIDNGAKIDPKGKDLNGAKNKDIIEFLLDKGSSPNAKTIGNLLYFCDNDIAEILLKNYVRNETFDEEMRLFINNNRIDCLEMLFKYINLDCTNALEYCLSISNPYNYNTECIKLLKDQCIRFNVSNV